MFDTLSGITHNAKSVSRRNTIGQLIATMAAQVTSGHCQRAGSDQRIAPGPDSTRPSSGIIQKKSREEFSLPRHTRKNAGIKYGIDSTAGSATNRTRDPINAITTRLAVANQMVCGGQYGVARYASAKAARTVDATTMTRVAWHHPRSKAITVSM